MTKSLRVGVIGQGFIGDYLARRIENASDMSLAFVWARRPNRFTGTSQGITDLADAGLFDPDIIVEAAHPDITRAHGTAFLTLCDYMPVSVSALSDDKQLVLLKDAATACGHRLLVPHGALMGTDNLLEMKDIWEEVTITFEKNPSAIDFSESGQSADLSQRKVVFEGPVRDIAALFPRNVNTMVTCGLATIGLDRCLGRLISDPALNCGIAEVSAVGKYGARLTMRKEQPMVGVSGTEMAAAILASLRRGTRASGMHFV